MAEKHPLVLGDEMPLEELQSGDTLAVGDYSLPASIGSDNQSLVVNGSSLEFETQDHGELAGLSDDDHSQYHNDARGDARYYTETELDAGQLDNRYYRENEHINSSAGAGDAGKPIILDSAGNIDATMLNDADIDHGSIGGLSDDDHTQYHNDSRAATWLGTNHETTYNHTNYDTAYGWGDHSLVGYLTAESDTLNDVVGRGASTATAITVGSLTDSALTSGRVVYATTSGQLTDSASLTFNGTDLSLAAGSDIIIADNTSTYMLYAGASSEVKATSKMTFDGAYFTLASGSGLKSADVLIIAPAATKAIQATTDGNTRGTAAVDFQTTRAVVSQVASGAYSAILGGSENTASGSYSAVLMGYQSRALGSYTGVFCGRTNIIDAGSSDTIIMGGYGNNVDYSYGALIASGVANSIEGVSGTTTNFDVICGGTLNVLRYATRSVICGGVSNAVIGVATSFSAYCIIGGGFTNTMTIGAGVVGDAGNTICGGYYNDIVGPGSKNTIVGGDGHTIGAYNGSYNFIGGGNINDIAYSAAVTNGYNTIAGGDDNYIEGGWSFIGGGDTNSITDCTACVIVGGSTNSITSATHSGILTGAYCSISSDYSSAIGKDAASNKYGQSSKASGKFSTAGDSQHSTLVARNQTTDATPTELFIDGSSSRLVISETMTWSFFVSVVARQTNDDYSCAIYNIVGLITRDTGGNATLLYSSTTSSYEDDATWDFAVSADTTNQSLKLLATGAAANNINWVATIELTETFG